MKRNKPPRRYDAHFRDQAVQLVLKTGRPVQTLAHELGISHTALQRWMAAHHQKQLTTEQQLAAAHIKIEDLQRQVEQITTQRDILKKSLGIFFEPTPPRNMPKSS